MFFLPAFNLIEEQGSIESVWVCVGTSGFSSDEQLPEVMTETWYSMRQTDISDEASFFDWEITEPKLITTEDKL